MKKALILFFVVVGALFSYGEKANAQCSGIPSANRVCAGPATGSGAPGWRALVNADIPSSMSSKTIADLTVTGSFTATGLVTNAALANPSTTVNGQTCTLGSTCTVTAVATTITVGTTVVASGTNTRVLYNNSGVLGEYTISGSGSVAMTNSATLVTPVLGVATATSINGLTITTTTGTLTIANSKTLTDTSGVGASILLGATGGGFSAYAGATCTNQFVRVLSAAGAATCQSVTNSYLTAGTFSNITGVGTLTAGTLSTGVTLEASNITWTGTVPVANLPVVADASGSPSATAGIFKADGTTIACSSGVCSAVGAVAASIGVGTTSVTSGTSDYLLYNNAGTLGNRTIASVLTSGTGIKISGTTNATVSAAIPNINGFVLTLTTGVCNPASDVTGATTIYLTPCTGNEIALYNGSSWDVISSAQVSLALGTLAGTTPYDVFAYNNSGTLTLEFTAWTNDTTRATALTTQDGVLVKTGATTRRYVGTFKPTSTTQTADSASNRLLYNYYGNLVKTVTVPSNTTGTFTYSTAAWQQWNNNTANQVNIMTGVEGQVFNGQVYAVSETSGASGDNSSVCIGLNSTTTIYAGCVGGTVQYTVAGRRYSYGASASIPLTARYNNVTFLQYGNGSATQTWYGSITAGNISGISGFIR